MITVAFVFELALGHRAHAQNLARSIGQEPTVRPVFRSVEFKPGRVGRRIPVYRSNWTVRAGLLARARLRAVKADVLFFHTQTPAVFSGRLRRRVPTVLSVDATPAQFDSLGTAYRHATGPAWLEGVKFRLNRASFHRAKAIVAFSHWVKASLVEDYGVDPAKVRVIRPGLDVDAQSRAERTDGPLRVLFVGGDFERKGGPTLLAAMDRLADLDLELDIVTRRFVPEGGSGRVFVHNNVSPADSSLLRTLYAEADVFCLPTQADALGLVFVEAAAAGLPLIGTDTGAVTEVVRHNETGLVVPVGDVDALADALRLLLTDPGLRDRFGRAARRLVEEEFDEKVTTRQLVGLLHEVAHHPKG